MIRRLLTPILVSLALGAGLLPAPGMAQDNPFAPRLKINDRVISQYEFEQRKRFLTLLRAPGDLDQLAMDALIEDRLRLSTAEQFDIRATDEQILAGMEEFAARANLTAEQFIAALAQAGVDRATFRDFVAAGLVWREVVKGRFAPQAIITDAVIDRALAQATRATEVRVLVSELILPAPAGQEQAVLDQARALRDRIASEGAFAAAARAQSAAASAARGGQLDWMPLSNLPPTIAPLILALAPGQVSDPVPIPGGVALFQLRGLEETRGTAPAGVAVDYAVLALPADGTGPAVFAGLLGRIDTCNDLYAAFPGASEAQLARQTTELAAVPGDIALVLAQLDPGEMALTPGGARAVMLCNRLPQAAPEPDRAAIRAQLLNQKLAGLADRWLAELRANAIITEY